MPMWAQTYKNGRRYYREHTGSRGHGNCLAAGGSIICEVADEQIGRVIEAIQLGPKWLEEALSIVSLKMKIERVKNDRLETLEKLRRMGKAYVDGLFPDTECHRQKRLLEIELESLVVPKANAAEEAGTLIMDIPRLWAEANPEEKRKLLLPMIDAVYVDAKEEKAIVAVKPKPAFGPIIAVATTQEVSEVTLIKELPHPLDQEAPCLWWRRGRVNLHLKHGVTIWIVANLIVGGLSQALTAA
jgi:site-specific DNA recombinase